MRVAVVLLLAACADDPQGAEGPWWGDDVPAGESAPASADPTDPGDPADPADTEEEPLPDDGPDPPEEPAAVPVRFIALGDAGEGNDDQYLVGDAIASVCARDGCDFALYLGDNFYDDGVYSVHDEQWETKFERPYEDVDFPFYAALGNHDFGEIPIQFWRTDYQVEYTQRSAKWTMPDHFYEFTEANATFLALDTNMIMLGLAWTQDQRGWVRDVLRRSSGSDWHIAYGHHPFKSNGEHGNAGNYEGAWYDVTGLVRGDNVESFFREELCRNIDLYLCGHDHNRQWLEPACQIELVVAGAGAKTDALIHRDGNPTIWEDEASEGFVWIEILGRTMTFRFYDKLGGLDYEGFITK